VEVLLLLQMRFVRFLSVSVVLVVMVVLVTHDNYISSSLRNTVKNTILRQRELQKQITAADYFDDFGSESSSSESSTDVPTLVRPAQLEDARSDTTANNFGEVPMGGATPDMITAADEYMMEGSEVPSFGHSIHRRGWGD
jgi:hypothetical protein